ncbi:MAG: amino acid racemase [Acetatifactor sp.]|jgi:aspartate racemase|nr:amino acid racemase [Acetatifactor sp.]
MKKLGVIGGLGPMATVYFLQLLTCMTQAETDQQHLEILVHSRPQIPDRTDFILGKSSRDPFPEMTEVGRGLARQGAELLAMPCITAHYFQSRLEEAIGVPVINAIEETAACLREHQISRAGILATDGTIESGLFQEKFREYGIEAVIPGEESQTKVMHLIYRNVKAGREVEIPLFEQVSRELFRGGAQVILLGCTELSLIKRDYPLRSGYLDVMEVLARKAVLSCGVLKEKYHELIT